MGTNIPPFSSITIIKNNAGETVKYTPVAKANRQCSQPEMLIGRLDTQGKSKKADDHIQKHLTDHC